jgi:hypothetical protein
MNQQSWPMHWDESACGSEPAGHPLLDRLLRACSVLRNARRETIDSDGHRHTQRATKSLP